MARRLPAALAMTSVLIVTVLVMPAARPLLHSIFPDLLRPIYTRATFLDLMIAHLRLVVIATGLAGAAAITTGVFVTRPAGRSFAPLARTLATIGQTFPPVAVFALAVPMLGYGAAPTFAALAVYAALPVLEATLTGLAAVPRDAKDAAIGLGFSNWRCLMAVELPLAAPLMLAGLRNATIINIGTATIGSSVGALSLGSPIIEGLSASNPAYVLEGAVIVAILAITTDRWFDVVETWSSVR